MVQCVTHRFDTRGFPLPPIICNLQEPPVKVFYFCRKTLMKPSFLDPNIFFSCFEIMARINVITFFKLNKIWIRLTKYSLWVKLKCSYYKTFFEMLRYLPLLAWKWPMKCSMKCKVSWYFISLWESLCSSSQLPVNR